MLAHGIIITKGKWVSLLRLGGDVRYQEDVREKEDRRWLPGATLAASRQEPTGIQAWFQAFDGEKKKSHRICNGAPEAESRDGETRT